MKMAKIPLKHVLAVTLATAAIVAQASARRPLPTPPPSLFCDTESSTCRSLEDDPNLGSHIRLTLAANLTPSNCVQVAFGQDTNGDEDLEPEETDLILGVSCGVPFVRDERVDAAASPRLMEGAIPILTRQVAVSTGEITTFTFRQPKDAASRYTFVKVTTRGKSDSAASIAAKIFNPPTLLILR